MNKIRKAVEPFINRMGIIAARTKIPANGWTAIGLVFAVFSAFYYLQPEGGFAGGILLLVSGAIDVLDGAVARLTGSVSKRGAFLDSTLDRVSEVIIFLAILSSGIGDLHVILLALSFSLLVSYTRARGESLGVTVTGIGVGERAERILVLAFFSIFGYTYIGVIVVLLLAFVTFIQRIMVISKSLSKPDRTS